MSAGELEPALQMCQLSLQMIESSGTNPDLVWIHWLLWAHRGFCML